MSQQPEIIRQLEVWLGEHDLVLTAIDNGHPDDGPSPAIEIEHKGSVIAEKWQL